MIATADYEALHVHPGASSEEIRAAYRACVKRYHPDLNRGGVDTTEKFKRIVAAYERLSKRIEEDAPDADAFDATASTPTSSPHEAASRSFRRATPRFTIHGQRPHRSVYRLNLYAKLERESLSELVRRFQTTRNDHLKVHLAYALARRQSVRAVDVLLDRLGASESPAVVVHLIRALAQTRSKRAVPSLDLLRHSRHGEVSREAAHAISLIAPKLPARLWRRLRGEV